MIYFKCNDGLAIIRHKMILEYELFILMKSKVEKYIYIRELRKNNDI